MDYDRARLKREVKLSMKGSGCMMATLLFGVIVGVGTWLLNTVFGALLTGGLGSWAGMISAYIQEGYEVEEAVERAVYRLLSLGPGPLVGMIAGSMVVSVIVLLWESSMGVSYEGWCLEMARGGRPPMGRLFCALPRMLQVLLTRFLTGLFIALWMLLLAVVYTVALVIAVVIGETTDLMALAVILVLAAIAALVVGVIWVSARYALVDYVLLDKGLSGLDAVRESKRLMKGNTGKYVVLQLSFFGWYLLGMVMVYVGAAVALVSFVGAIASGGSGGWLAASGISLVVVAVTALGSAILSLWLKPYTTGAMARFYDWTQGRPCGAVQGPGPGGDGSWGNPGDYTWNSGPGAGTGTGTGSGGGFPPTPPSPPRGDDPWD